MRIIKALFNRLFRLFSKSPKTFRLDEFDKHKLSFEQIQYILESDDEDPEL